MADHFLRLVARHTKLEDAQAKGDRHTELFGNRKKASEAAGSRHAASSQAAAALNFFGSAAPATPATTSPKGTQQRGIKRAREEPAEEDGGADPNEQPVDDGENDLEGAADEDEDENTNGANEADAPDEDEDEDDGVQLFNRGPKSGNGASRSSSSAAVAIASKPAVSKAKLVKEKRRDAGIHVQGSDIPPPFGGFDELPKAPYDVPAFIVENLSRPIEDGGCGYDAPTPVQQQAIPLLLKGRDILACAPTGSGKTAAFAVPVLARLKAPGKSGFRALVLAPTRELSEQTHRCFTQLSMGRKFKIFHLSKANANQNSFGGGSKDGQPTMNRDVLITTPMRLVHLLENDAIDLSHVEFLIMDEADRLFELGFLEQIDKVLAACTNPALKRALFSATMEQGVESIARTVLRDPVRMVVGARNSATSSIRQQLVFVGSEEGKLMAFRQMLSSGLSIPILLFVQSKERAKQLYQELVFENLAVDVIHADRTAAQRTESIRKFRAGTVWALICTDLMARGIDFKGVNTVLQYDFPQSTVDYIHRIGRTGRAGRQGNAVTLFTEADKPLLPAIAKLVRQSGSEVPDWMLQMHKMGTKKAKRLKDVAPPRTAIVQNPKTNAKNKQARDRKKKRKLLAASGGAAAPGASSSD